MSERPDTPAELKLRALRLLAQREHSRAELERKLLSHCESAAALRGMLDELLSKGRQSDERYAEERARVLSRKYGAARIRHDLRGRGIPEALADKVAPPENDLEKARQILARKYREPAASREERAKRARFLQSRGFSYDVIHRLVLGAEAE